VPVFADGDLTRLERACAGRSFQRRGDIALWQREITVRGRGGKTRTVKIGYEAARSLDRYLRVRIGDAQAFRRQLWPHLWVRLRCGALSADAGRRSPVPSGGRRAPRRQEWIRPVS
jgi:hypothetical protein